MKARALRDNSMTSYMTSKKTMEVKPTHSIMTELKNKASADKSDKTVKDLIWLFFYASLLTLSFNLNEPMQFSGRMNRMIKLELSINDVDGGLGDDEDIPPLEVEGAADEASKMGDVDEDEARGDLDHFDFAHSRVVGACRRCSLVKKKTSDSA